MHLPFYRHRRTQNFKAVEDSVLTKSKLEGDICAAQSVGDPIATILITRELQRIEIRPAEKKRGAT
jgi:hypothetical protein